MSSFRKDKIEKQIQEEISLIFLHKLQDKEFGIITVTHVKMSPDLKIAKIYVSVFNKEKREYILEHLTSINGLIRHQLASRIHVKYIPEIKFFIDDTMDYVEKIDGLIKKIHEDDNKSSN